MAKPEILAPAGGWESLEAAVRSGANAVYLGGKSLNARRGAANFDEAQLKEAVSFCHVRNAKVYVTLNTVVFDKELAELEAAAASICAAGADGVIVQDLAVAKVIRECAPSLPLHASTQMSVHNLDGVKVLEQLGFSRAVLARELSRKEIEYITARTKLEIECFVHGALCMCISGQCYLSAMIGGRSGNRGLCAQPCRLPFEQVAGRKEVSAFALSLKDLSLIESIQAMADAGIKSLKIEGRLKRPEYVAAAVTACKKAINAEKTDIKSLQAVFSRGGFTDGYFSENLGDHMFGVRSKDDVTSTASVLKELAKLYERESPLVPVNFAIKAKTGKPLELSVSDENGNTITTAGSVPQVALNAPFTPEKADALLAKTGGTPYFIQNVNHNIDNGLMVPASAVNALRREALEKLSLARGNVPAHQFTKPVFSAPKTAPGKTTPKIRVRLQKAGQLSDYITDNSDEIVLPVSEFAKLPPEAINTCKDKLFAELPRICFGKNETLEKDILSAKNMGITNALAGSIGGISLAKRHALNIHTDFGFNITNHVALEELAVLGASSCTLSFELAMSAAKSIAGMPRGIIAYGYLPLMTIRNHPLKANAGAYLTDRLGNKFRIGKAGDAFELFNNVPLYLADKRAEMLGFDFITLYFTNESTAECADILNMYQTGAETDKPKTRGLYFRKVL